MTTSSRWIRWPGFVAWALLLLLGVAVLIVRSGNWELGLGVYAIAGLASLSLLALFAVLFLIPKFNEQRGATLRSALPAVPGAVLLVMAMQGAKLPQIHDITTDTNDPPVFEAAQALRGENSNPIFFDEEVLTQQLEAYPDLAPLRSPRSFASSYNLALRTAQGMGWDITREDSNAGFIEAVATTALMQFKDDVVIRVRTNADGSIVDLRSVSRVGRSDLGANAARIRKFQKAFLKGTEG
ncbi:MAG: DUF1499 domain-containing protein [Pseudomonadota bacterium]